MRLLAQSLRYGPDHYYPNSGISTSLIQIFTGKPPFAHHRMDSAVIHDILSGVRPDRPEEPYPLSDTLWEAVRACWSELPDHRPSIEHVLQWILPQGLTTLSQKQPGWDDEPSWVDLVDGWLDAQSIHSSVHSKSRRGSFEDLSDIPPLPPVSSIEMDVLSEMTYPAKALIVSGSV